MRILMEKWASGSLEENEFVSQGLSSNIESFGDGTLLVSVVMNWIQEMIVEKLCQVWKNQYKL